MINVYPMTTEDFDTLLESALNCSDYAELERLCAIAETELSAALAAISDEPTDDTQA